MPDATNQPSQQPSTPRSTTCPAHGLRYDARSTAGCVLCRQEQAAQKRGRRDRALHLTLFTLLLVTLVAGIGYWRAPALRESFNLMKRMNVAESQAKSTSSTAQNTSYAKIDPEPVRAEIEALEALLYGTNKSWTVGNQLAITTRALSSKIPPSPSAAPIRAALARYTEMHSIEEEGGYVGVNVESARDEWEKIRDRSFEAAPWFSQATGASLREARASDASERAEAMLAFCDHLDRVIERTATEVLALPEVAEVVSAEQRREVSEWEEWARNWDGELQQELRGFPSHPGFDTDANLTFAFQKLESAAHALRLLPVSSGDWPTAAMYMREMRLEEARAAVREAREYLAKVPRVTDETNAASSAQ